MMSDKDMMRLHMDTKVYKYLNEQDYKHQSWDFSYKDIEATVKILMTLKIIGIGVELCLPLA